MQRVLEIGIKFTANFSGDRSNFEETLESLKNIITDSGIHQVLEETLSSTDVNGVSLPRVVTISFKDC